MKAINTNLIITRISSKVDGSLGLSASTPELTPEERIEFMKLQNLNLSCLLSPMDYKSAPEFKIDKEINQKTPAQRLRNTLYVLWEQNGSQEDFEIYYKNQMEKLIEHFKAKLI